MRLLLAAALFGASMLAADAAKAEEPLPRLERRAPITWSPPATTVTPPRLAYSHDPSVWTTPRAAGATPAAKSRAGGGGSGGGGDLAKKLQNPVADLISLPIQGNIDFGLGATDAQRYLVNVQPVIPMSLGEDWNLISRTILPIVHAEAPTAASSDVSGIGDVVQSFFLSPKDTKGGPIWGVGPVLLLPTGTESGLSSEKWGAGPTAVVLKQDGPWTYGGLVNHIWSFAGESDRRDVNATFLQPFVSYTFPTAFSIGLNLESSYDWTREQWTVPVNLTFNQVTKIGTQPVSLQMGLRYYAESPRGGPEWGIRMGLTLLFPKT